MRRASTVKMYLKAILVKETKVWSAQLFSLIQQFGGGGLCCFNRMLPFINSDYFRILCCQEPREGNACFLPCIKNWTAMQIVFAIFYPHTRLSPQNETFSRNWERKAKVTFLLSASFLSKVPNKATLNEGRIGENIPPFSSLPLSLVSKHAISFFSSCFLFHLK